MEIREADLPGVGRKFSFAIADGTQVVIVIYMSGRREVFRFSPADEPEPVLDLSDDEAHKVGAILAGSYFQPVREDPTLQIMKGLHLRWARIGPGSALAGRTIRELEVRRRTGASVIAIARATSHIPNPSPEERFAEGDTVIAIGSADQLRAFETLTTGR